MTSHRRHAAGGELESALAALLGDRPYELSPLGLYCRREVARTERLVAAERVLLQHGSLRVFDLQLGRPCDLAENAIPTEDADPAAYEGAPRPGGVRVFRVDHHHPLERLRRETTTALVLAWLRGLWERGRTELLAEVARARYLADHADPDILLAHRIALDAQDRAAIFAPELQWLLAAARRNDYVEPPPAELEPQASRAFYACLGIERAIEAGTLGFAEAERRWLRWLLPWLRAEAPAEAAEQLARWEQEQRAAQARVLERLERWSREGRLVQAAGGRVVQLGAPHKIDAAELVLYLRLRPPAGAVAPQLALLHFAGGEDGARLIYKLRALDPALDLQPLFARLEERFPGAGFGGRAAAGGSRPTAGIEPQAVLAEAADWLQRR
ncbi:MAG: hypothetical protein KatS3mg102_1523 [Planctomycetota bacterium]|nr:MAG: hypothetical protein KatS3mg102_1523 [Planctomycetota bacterium]